MAFFECLVGGSGDGSTLTVTCYSGFAGLTISITNGVDTFRDVCPSTSPYEVVFDGLANGTWTLSTVYNGVTYTETVEVNNTSQFYPIPNGETTTPTDDIQTWLYCASIFDKNYTSIAQVLADASTLQALIASNNAADYMARSTSWASRVTANSNAMTYIGANNYCANKLLANSTWLNAICNSAYFESVLNVKVPTMTSNTTPYGKAFASSTVSTSYPAWKAFDGVEYSSGSQDAWVASASDASPLIYYEFPHAVKIKMAITQANQSSAFSVNLVKSNGNSWSVVKTITQGALGVTTITKAIDGGEALQWGFKRNSANMGFFYIQFYGRA